MAAFFLTHLPQRISLLLMVGVPPLMGSLYGILLAGIGCPLLMFRIMGEERMLTDELDGYAEYKTMVRYRLIPLVW